MDWHLRADSMRQRLLRICGEYLEMPGLCLTRAQAQRLWCFDAETCSALLNILIEAGFLRLTRDGKYIRVTDAIPLLNPWLATA